MDVSDEWMVIEELAGMATFSPRRVIVETWKVIEQALGKAFPRLARSEENRWVASSILLNAVEETKELDPKILEALRVLYDHKERISSREVSGEEEGEEDELPRMAETCVASGRTVLGYLARFKPKRKYQGATARPEESGARRSAVLGGRHAWMVGGMVLAGGLWLTSFLLPGNKKVGETRPPDKPGVPLATSEQNGNEILGFWKRSDGVIMRIVPHPNYSSRFVGFIVKAPADLSAPYLKAGESVLVVNAGDDGRYKGYQKIAGEENKWKAIEFVIENNRMEADGGLFEHISGESINALRFQEAPGKN